MSLANLLLHPLRLRVVQAFLGGRTLTTGELRTLLPDVPLASLYRQVATLVDGKVLQLVSERKIRGALERTYRLNVAQANLGPEQTAQMDGTTHRRAFMAFVATLLGDFDRYLAREEPDLARDGVGYRQLVLNLSDAELGEFASELGAVIKRWTALESSPERVRRLLSTILMPTR